MDTSYTESTQKRTPQNHHINRHGERGNVLFYILIAVSMLGALSYAVTQSSRGNVTQMSTERNKLVAGELIEYSNVMVQAVSQLRLRGVDEDELCFDDPAWGADDYDHAGCTDNYNKIYHPDGAALSWSGLPDDAVDAGASPDNLWHINGANEVEGIGTTCGSDSCVDLLLIADELKQNVCTSINDLLGVSNPSEVPPSDMGMSHSRFMGVYGFNETMSDEDVNLISKQSACYLDDDTGVYTFYTVLLAR